MAQIDRVYEYLQTNYRENEPILLSDVRIMDMKDASIRQQMKKLTDRGLVKRFDTGIYYIPKKTILGLEATLSVDDIIRKKYLMNGDAKCGYITGMMFANQLGLTTQVPMVYEVCSNKATARYRQTRVGKFRLLICKPYVEINDQNADALQFLDLLLEVSDISEIEGQELTDRLLAYLKEKKLHFDSLRSYMLFYPYKIYMNMYEVGLLIGTI